MSRTCFQFYRPLYYAVIPERACFSTLGTSPQGPWIVSAIAASISTDPVLVKYTAAFLRLKSPSSLSFYALYANVNLKKIALQREKGTLETTHQLVSSSSWMVSSFGVSNSKSAGFVFPRRCLVFYYVSGPKRSRK